MKILRHSLKIVELSIFENKMTAQNLSQTNPFFFAGRTTTGRNFAPRTKNEKVSENIYKSEVSIVGFSRNFDFSKNGFNFNRKNWFQRRFFLLKLKFFEKSKFRKNPTMLASFLHIFQNFSRFFVPGAKM